MKVIINPGTFEVEGTEYQANVNIRHFVSDLGGDIVIGRDPDKDYGGGRYCFILEKNGVKHEVQMPACSLGIVTGEECDSVFQQPRLYVDGSSWLWGFALGMCDFGED